MKTATIDVSTSARPPRPGPAPGNSFIVAVAALGLALFFGQQVAAGDWPQFRGPNATGVAAGATGLPVTFSHEENVKWSARPGRGIASPVISGGRVFTTAMLDEQTFAVIALDAGTGDELWRQSFPTGELPDITPPNEHASSTPATDGDRVYVHFSTLGLLALDAENGALAWQHKLRTPFYLMDWGAANSPIVLEDLVIFNLDDDLSPFLLAVDKYSGEVRWQTPRPDMLGGYSVPVLCTANGRTDVVVAGTGKLKGYDPHTGRELWTCNTLLRTIMTTPVVHGDTIFISVQSYGDTDRVLKYALLQWKDTNQDGKLDKTEIDEAFYEKFDKGDQNGDGLLVEDEIDVAFQSPQNMVGGGNIIQSIRGGGLGDVTDTHLVWSLSNTAPSNIASPLVVGDRLFVVKRGGVTAAFQVDSGETIWMKQRIRNFGNYYASPIAGDGKIYVTGENGFIVVLQDGPEPLFLSKNDMGGSCVATPAIADNRLYVRTLENLYCISEGAR